MNTREYRSYGDVENALAELAEITHSITKKEAEMNTKLQQIKEKFESESRELRESKSILETSIEAFCKLHRKDFEKSRSKEFLSGVIGFRNNPPKVVQLNKKYNVKTTIELIKKLGLTAYLRVKEELNKEMILADYRSPDESGKSETNKLDDSKLSAIGLRVDQDESFFIEIKKEILEAEK